MAKKNFKKSLLIAIIIGIVSGCIMAQLYFYLFGSPVTDYMQMWPIQVLVYVLMFPFIIGGLICDSINVDSYKCIPSLRYVFPVSYALLFAVIYSLYYRFKE